MFKNNKLKNSFLLQNFHFHLRKNVQIYIFDPRIFLKITQNSTFTPKIVD